PRCRRTVPTHWWAARPRSCPVAARPRTQTAAAPCLTSSPPEGSQGRHRRRCALPVPLVPVTPHPSHEGVSRIAPAPAGARARLADLAGSDIHVMLALYCHSRQVVMANKELNGPDMVGEGRSYWFGDRVKPNKASK